jgi:beta-N-acetylglucosaminidase
MLILSAGTLTDISAKISESADMALQIESLKKENDVLKRLLDEEAEKYNDLIQWNAENNAFTKKAINYQDIANPSGISISIFNLLLAGTGLNGLGASVFEAEHIYNINGIFIISVAQLESGHGTSVLAQMKNNLFGMNAWGSNPTEVFRRAYKYESKTDSILAFAKHIRENYISKGRTTIKTIGDIYCELSNHWINSITILMNRNAERLKELGEE